MPVGRLRSGRTVASRVSGRQSQMPQQGLYARPATSKRDEQIHGVPGAALFQHRVQKLRAGGPIEDPTFLELGVGIGGQHLGPFVAVITGGVPAGEDMPEPVLEAVEGRRFDHRDLVANPIQDRLDRGTVIGPGQPVQAEVEQREFDLSQHLQAGLEVPRVLHALEQIGAEGLAGLVVAADDIQGLAFPAPVFHELARQLDRVPGDAVDPGDARVVHPRQEMVEAVPELVEQGDDLAVRQERGLFADRGCEIAGQVSDRRLQAFGAAAPHDALVHPGPATLVRSGIEVEVESAPLRPVRVVDLEEPHVRVPDLDLRARMNGDPVEPAGDGEETLQHLRYREEGTERFL